MWLDAERLEHIPSGWNQPDGICPVIQDGPVRALKLNKAGHVTKTINVSML
jgi:hypothetical protein